MSSPPLLWTVERAAAELSLSKQHIYRLTRENKIPFVRVGTAVRFSPAALQQWLADKQVEAVRR